MNEPKVPMYSRPTSQVWRLRNAARMARVSTDTTSRLFMNRAAPIAAMTRATR